MYRFGVTRCCCDPVPIDPGTEGDLRKFGSTSSDPGAGIWIRDCFGSGSRVFAIAVDGSGNVYAGGDGDVDGFITRKYTADGALVWSNDDVVSSVSSLVLNSSGELIEFGHGVGESIVRKLDTSDGSETWTTEGDGIGAGVGIALDASDNIHLLQPQHVVKISDSDGSVLTSFLNIRTGDANDIAFEGGNFYVVGDRELHPTSGWRTLQKFDSSFTETWHTDHTADLYGVAANGNIVAVVGDTIGPGYTDGVQAYNHSGVSQWTAAGGYVTTDQGQIIAVDGSDNVYAPAVDPRYVNKISSGTVQWAADIGQASVGPDIDDAVYCVVVVDDVLYTGQEHAVTNIPA